jgi:hypothetical protein
MEQLMQKLMVSKAIMDKTNNIARGTTQGISLPSTELQNFQPTDAKYNIPQEFLGEAAMSRPTKNPSIPTVDAIKNSKLPDAIKKLMIEHPIEQPNSMSGGAVLSDELVERASRLMGNSKKPVVEQAVPQQNTSDLRRVLKEVVQEVLTENGLLMEGAEKSNELFRFQVGKHLFEGKLTKIKKLS